MAVALDLCIEFHRTVWNSPAQILEAIENAARDLRDQVIPPTADTWGTSPEAIAANEAAMARAGGPAQIRRPQGTAS